MSAAGVAVAVDNVGRGAADAVLLQHLPVAVGVGAGVGLPGGQSAL